MLVAGDTAGREGLSSYLSTWGSQSRGEGDRQSPSPFGPLGGLGRQAKDDLAERRKNWRRKKTDSGSCPNVLSAPGDRVVVGKSLTGLDLFLTGQLKMPQGRSVRGRVEKGPVK